VLIRHLNEWDDLAAWVIDNQIFSDNIRWIIQTPRLFDVYFKNKVMDSFETIIRNLFQPLFEVTKDPRSHPKLHLFLKLVVGFDSVDDESKIERRTQKKFPFPKYWTSAENPPYSYYLYYIYVNMCSLNQFRRMRNMNTFVLRPHSGEAGDPHHLIFAFLTSQSICHGILLRKLPALQYL
jgi:AMP deaminase